MEFFPQAFDPDHTDYSPPAHLLHGGDHDDPLQEESDSRDDLFLRRTQRDDAAEDRPRLLQSRSTLPPPASELLRDFGNLSPLPPSLEALMATLPPSTYKHVDTPEFRLLQCRNATHLLRRKNFGSCLKSVFEPLRFQGVNVDLANQICCYNARVKGMERPNYFTTGTDFLEELFDGVWERGVMTTTSLELC